MRITVSLPESVVNAVQARATADNRSLSNMFSTLVQEALAASNGSQPVAPPVGGKAFRGMDPRKK